MGKRFDRRKAGALALGALSLMYGCRPRSHPLDIPTGAVRSEDPHGKMTGDPLWARRVPGSAACGGVVAGADGFVASIEGALIRDGRGRRPLSLMHFPLRGPETTTRTFDRGFDILVRSADGLDAPVVFEWGELGLNATAEGREVASWDRRRAKDHALFGAAANTTGSVALLQALFTNTDLESRLLVGFDAAGEKRWSRAGGWTAAVMPSGGGVIAVGSRWVPDKRRLAPRGVAVHLDSDGKLVWQSDVGDVGDLAPMSVAMAPEGRVVIAGRYWETTDDMRSHCDPAESRIFNPDCSSRSGDMFLLELDAKGKRRWLELYRADHGNVLSPEDPVIADVGIAVGPEGHICLVAEAANGRGVLVRSFTRDGKRRWRTRVPLPNLLTMERPSVALGPSGHVYFCGSDVHTAIVGAVEEHWEPNDSG